MGILAAAALSWAVPAAGKDLGVHGQVWAIAERDMRLAIALDAAQIDWAAQQAALQQQARNYTATIGGWQVPVAEHTATRYIDPSITISEPIHGYVREKDGSFRWGVLYPAGTTVNPLAYGAPLTWQLLIDPTNPAQMQLAEEVMARQYHRVMLVLTRGDPGKLAKMWDYPIYFAQELHFTRFGVTHTPSLVGVNPARPLEIEVTHFAYPYQAAFVESYLP